MSLLNKTKSSLRRNIFLVIAATLLLAVPVVGAAAFAVNFNVEPAFQERQTEELKERIEHETDAAVFHTLPSAAPVKIAGTVVYNFVAQ